MIEEEESVIRTLKKEDVYARKNSERRLQYFKATAIMFDQKRVRFIDIEDELERDEIIELISRSPEVPKTAYSPSMNTETMKQKFADLITVSCDTWSLLVLEKLFCSLPKEIETITSQYAATKGEV
jgi:hypothetical protein